MPNVQKRNMYSSFMLEQVLNISRRRHRSIFCQERMSQ